MLKDVTLIQQTLRRWDIDGWLLYDFHRSNPIAYEILNIQNGIITRRWFYWIPKEGTPIKLIHSIEAEYFENLPGRNCVYTGWQEMNAHLEGMLSTANNVAMEYSPHGAIPYISRVDSGTIELIKSFHVDVVSSADLVQLFQSRWDEEAYDLHKQTVPQLFRIKDDAFRLVAEKIKQGNTITEFQLQNWLLQQYEQYELTSDNPPIVAVNDHSGQPHYSPTQDTSKPIKEGDFLLLDIWAKKPDPRATYVDITWTAFAGAEVPERYQHIFEIVASARDCGVQLIRDRWDANQSIAGWEVDNAVRAIIEEAGYGKFFTHRTGHSLDTSSHGNGVNIDNLETQDRRKIIPGLGFTIEPGIYLSEFGVRSEIDVFIEEGGPVVTTTPLQTAIIPLLK